MNRSLKFFITDREVVVPAVTTDQMREVDRIATEETGPNLFQMMENAGCNLALSAIDMMGPHWKDARYVVIAGGGGNGGGGICAARHLANRKLNVRLCLANPEKLGGVPGYQRHVFQSTNGREVRLDELKQEPVDLILDAIIGYSLKAAPRGIALDMIHWANEAAKPILSLDVPSGVDSTTGKTAGEFIRATRTLTLALPKTGLIPEKTGELFLADIGIPEAVYKKLDFQYVNPFDDRYIIPLRQGK